MSKWSPTTAVFRSDVTQAKSLLKETIRPGKRAYARYVQFCNFHKRDPTQMLSIAIMASTMHRRGLKATTIHKYLTDIANYKFYDWSRKKINRVRRIAKAVYTKWADGIRNSAPVWTVAELRELVDRIPKGKDYDAFFAMCDMWFVHDLRTSELQSTPFSAVQERNRHFFISIVGGKTRSGRPTERVTRRVPKHRLLARTQRYLSEAAAQGGDSLLMPLDTDAVNRLLKTLSPDGNITTYSFRNAVIGTAIEEHTDSEGLTDWAKVASVTGHRSIKALKANYGYMNVSEKAQRRE